MATCTECKQPITSVRYGLYKQPGEWCVDCVARGCASYKAAEAAMQKEQSK